MSGNGSHRMLRSALALSVFMSVLALAEARAQQGGMGTTAAAVTYLEQNWSAAERDAFYTTSQGSHIMPYAWFKALRRTRCRRAVRGRWIAALRLSAERGVI